MRVLIVSDIHSNFTALEAVLQDAGAIDEVWCLGDIVGYGPDPNQVIERLRGLPNLQCIAGNHDAGVLDQIPLSAFNPDAAKAVVWTARVLSKDNRAFLESLPSSKPASTVVTLAHASPRDPVWEYVADQYTAELSFRVLATPHAFVGHTHVQRTFTLLQDDQVRIDTPAAVTPVVFAGRTLANPGSVGQPRDRNPLSAYAIFDPERNTWEPRRIAYDIPAVQKRIIKLGLPDRHAVRLSAGW